MDIFDSVHNMINCGIFEVFDIRALAFKPFGLALAKRWGEGRDSLTKALAPEGGWCARRAVQAA